MLEIETIYILYLVLKKLVHFMTKNLLYEIYHSVTCNQMYGSLLFNF